MNKALALPVCRWFVQDYDDNELFKVTRWMPLDDESSTAAEDAFNLHINDKVFFTSRKTVLNLKRMSERDNERKGVDRVKRVRRAVRRGTWFYQEEKNEWIPYEPAQALSLEDAYRSGCFKRVDVSSQPTRFVLCDSTGEFRQYRLSTNANPEGRLVIRGYDKLLEYLSSSSQTLLSSSRTIT
jgi:hypothetical protein